MGLRPRLTGEFQIILHRPPPIDYAPRVLVEVASDFPKEQYNFLMADTMSAISNDLNVSVSIELVEEGSISTEKKSQRLVRQY